MYAIILSFNFTRIFFIIIYCLQCVFVMISIFHYDSFSFTHCHLPILFIYATLLKIFIIDSISHYMPKKIHQYSKYSDTDWYTTPERTEICSHPVS